MKKIVTVVTIIMFFFGINFNSLNAQIGGPSLGGSYQAYFDDGCFWICTSMSGNNCSSPSDYDDWCD